jgi:23S rRNA (cytidine1920-2'-O)/16S rRNA (cytidine1409-2'-O)-methyltransferase
VVDRELIKPQFEVGRGAGWVAAASCGDHPAKHAQAVDTVNNTATELGLYVAGVIESTIPGREGNVEFLAHYQRV